MSGRFSIVSRVCESDRRFVGARTRTGIYSEHAAAEKCEALAERALSGCHGYLVSIAKN